MACFIGALGKFDPKSETVGSYEERLKLYLIANDIAANAGNEERRKAIFLRYSALGKTWVSGPAHQFSVFGPTVMYYI